MHIYCLTKLLLYDEFKNFTQFEGFDSDPSSEDYYKFIRENMFYNELKNSCNYAFSEIRIGKAKPPGYDEKEKFWFLLFRNNIMVGKFILEDKTMKVQSIQATENDKIITITVDQKAINCPFFYMDRNDKYQNTINNFFCFLTIKEIQIRCIKAFKKGEKAITMEARNLFTDYANTVNEMLTNFDDNELDDSYENAFDDIGPLKLPDEAGKKAAGQKVIDLREAIETFCHGGKFKQNSRYNYPIENQLDFVFFKRIKKNRGQSERSKWIDKKLIKPYHYDDRTDVTRDFSTVSTLHYENVNPPKMNLQWFNAPALTWLTFNNCRVFETPDAWKIFEENINQLENLRILKITNCEYLTEIPSTLFSKLPGKVDCLIFDGNDLTKISPEISTVYNLRYLNLDKNPDFSNDGIPWQFLPDTLEILCLKETTVTKLPATMIERLKNLKQIDLPVSQLEEIDAEELTKKFSGLTMDLKLPRTDLDESSMFLQRPAHTSFMFHPSTSNKKHGLTLNYRELESYPWETLSETLTDLNLSCNKLACIGSLKHLKKLKSLSVVGNKIATIKGLPESLEIIDFSNNLLTDAGFLADLKILKRLRVADNQIDSIPWEHLSEKLEEICLVRNNIPFVGSLKHLTQLSTLSLHGNEISSVLWEDLPEGLKEMYIGKNRIEAVGSMKHLKHLTSLNLEENQIISIEWECLPKNLKNLMIYDNLLTYMGSMKHVQRLKFLNAHNNRFETVEWEDLPESLHNINVRENCLTRVGSIKQLKNLQELDLNHNQITSVLWEDLPEMITIDGIANTSEIDLSHNTLTSVGTFPHMRDLRTLRLNDNRITLVEWEFLPACLETLDLSDNHLTSIGSIKHMAKLEYLKLEYNQLTSISDEIFTLSSLDDLRLNNNEITEIQKTTNLDNFILPHLDLSNNQFDFNKGNLVEKLFNCLPFCHRLILNYNNLVELPCPLAGNAQDIHAVDCNLEYICPKLTSHAINLNIGANPKYVLSLHPKTLYPSQYPRDEDDYDTEEYPYIIGDLRVIPNTKKFRKNKNIYFNVKPENYGDKFSCKCCATCIKVNRNLKIVENVMVMDFFFLDYETLKNKHDMLRADNRALFEWEVFDEEPNPIGIPSQWKTTIRTRICEECQKFTTKLIENVNAEHNCDDIEQEEPTTTKKSRNDDPIAVEEGNNSAYTTDAIDTETPDTFHPEFFDLPQQFPQALAYRYYEPHGSSSTSIPSTTFGYPQERPSTYSYHYEEPNGSSSRSLSSTNVAYTQPSQPFEPYHENYNYPENIPHDDFSNRHPPSVYNNGSMIERIVIQDPYGNCVITAPATSINNLQTFGNHVNPEVYHSNNFISQGTQSTFTNLLSTNVPSQPGYITGDESQCISHQQQIQNPTNFMQLQEMSHFGNTNTTFNNDSYFHQQNPQFQNPSYDVVYHSSNTLDDINKL